MNIQHLRYALEVEKTGSISKAAENLYLNQPHLSKAIRDLEENIGITVFNRTSKGVVPTKKGSEFLVYARNIVSQVEEVENLYKHGESDSHNFNVSVPMACYVAQAFIEFVKDIAGSDNMCIHYHETNSIVAINSVTNHENNIAIIRYQTVYEKYFLQFLEERDLDVDPLWEFSYQLIMSIHNPLAMKKAINVSDLEDYIEITHGYLTIPSIPASKAREIRMNEGAKREIAVYERESQFMLLRNIHKTYMWASPTPASIMDTMPLIEKKCNMKNNKYKDVIICRKGYRMTSQEKLFVEKVRKEIEKLNNVD
ncbi:MAG: LysR family transcriptional regulator [Clostridia bacterium]|nr:LysR family transcriptional regulator [Clostridia bacterium]